ncbi:c-type cytochrome [Flagellimonas sp. S174]|uniref:c-type cytochrome n=1 Tax=Flagellimonas sp. S174 TaxID=3410790 RepID=UPI003BF5059F
MKHYSLVLSSLFALAACQPTMKEQSMARGKEIYIANCITCHQPDGNGITGIYPSLVRSNKISMDQTKRAVQLISHGSLFEGGMKPIHLSEKEIGDVINYIQNSWGNETPATSTTELRAIINN